MRSEERSGIIAIALLLLWGTLVTEPFRYFATIICDGVTKILSKTPVATHPRISSLIVSLVIVAITILLLKVSSTSASNYYGPVFASISLFVFLIRSLIAKSIDFKMATVLIVSVALIVVIMLLKNERIWIWLSDIYIFSFPMFLISAWVFKPIANLSAKASKYMFISFRSEVDFASSFKGLLTLPGIIWGLFFTILYMLPVLYFVVGRRKG